MTAWFRPYIALYHVMRRLRKRPGFYDDIFLTNHFRKLSRRFRIAPHAVAARFAAAYEDWDEAAFPFTNQDQASLPFGVHGWTKFHLDFWPPCIRRCCHLLPGDPLPELDYALSRADTGGVNQSPPGGSGHHRTGPHAHRSGRFTRPAAQTATGAGL